METLRKKRKIVVLYCQRCVEDNSGVALAAESVKTLDVQPVMMPCSSKIQAHQLLKILDGGADGIEVVACPEDACCFLVGSTRAEKRIVYARGLLKSININVERIGMSRRMNVSASELMALVQIRVEAINNYDTEKGDNQ